jgi:transposase-like protein
MDTTTAQTKLLDKLAETGDKISRLEAQVASLKSDRLIPLIIAAENEGLSLRTIGGAVGVSHVTIMRMLDRA